MLNVVMLSVANKPFLLNVVASGENLKVVWAEFSTFKLGCLTDNTINPLNANGHY
jgi:hypothetical protein